MFSRLAPRSRRARLKPVSRRPEVEFLEDRTVPSIASPTITIANDSDDETQPAVAAAGGKNSNPAIAPVGIIVWQQEVGSGDNDILAQRFNPKTGQKVGGVITIADTGDDETNADVTIDRDGDFVVVWTVDDGTGNLDVKYALFDDQDNEIVRDDVAPNLADLLDGDEQDPTVAMNSVRGSFVISYSFSKDSDVDVLAQRYDSLGERIGKKITVSGKGSKNEFDPRVDMNDGGKFAISYLKSFDGIGDAREVWVNRYSKGGNRIGKFKIALTESEVRHDVGIDNDARMYVVYDTGNPSDSFILLRRVTSNAKAVVFLTAAGDDIETRPQIAVARKDGDFAVTYQSVDSDDVNHVFVAEFKRNGVLKLDDDDNPMRHDLGDDLTKGAVAIDALDNYFVAFEEETSSSFDIKARYGKLEKK